MIYKNKPWEELVLPPETEWSEGFRKSLNDWLHAVSMMPGQHDPNIVTKKCYWNYRQTEQRLERMAQSDPSAEELVDQLRLYGLTSRKVLERAYCD